MNIMLLQPRMPCQCCSFSHRPGSAALATAGDTATVLETSREHRSSLLTSSLETALASRSRLASAFAPH